MNFVYIDFRFIVVGVVGLGIGVLEFIFGFFIRFCCVRC